MSILKPNPVPVRLAFLDTPQYDFTLLGDSDYNPHRLLAPWFAGQMLSCVMFGVFATQLLIWRQHFAREVGNFERGFVALLAILLTGTFVAQLLSSAHMLVVGWGDPKLLFAEAVGIRASRRSELG